MVVHKKNNVKNSLLLQKNYFSSPLLRSSSSFFHSTNEKFRHILLFQLYNKKGRLQDFRSLYSPEQNLDQMFG